MTTLTRTLIALVASVGLSLGLASGAAHANEDVTLTLTELPGQIRLIPGEAVELRLETNRTTGYTWKAQVRGDKQAVSAGKGVYTAPNTDLIGAPGTTSWLIIAEEPGTATVRIVATPPGGGTPSISKLKVIVMNP
jgi:predicted secreted protein